MQADGVTRELRERAKRRAEDAFPPQTSRSAEITALIEMLRGVIPNRSATYVSAPITSGRRFVEWYARRGSHPISGEQYQREHLTNVIQPNRSAVMTLVQHARERVSELVIDPTAVGDIEGWTQGDYRTAWANVIEQFVGTVVFANGWEFSNGCSYEFLVAAKAGIKRLDESWRPIEIEDGLSLLRVAIRELASRELPVDFLGAIVEDIESLANINSERSSTVSARELGARTLKDVVLDSLANHGNVAQFVSFSPSLETRYSRIAGYEPNARFENIRDAIDALVAASVERSVNVRSYHPDHPQSREFIYGIRESADAEAGVRRLAHEGLYTIVNETVDINDGGVSGVALDDVIEFAPGDTPRCVEKPGVLSLPREVGIAMLRRVYGFAPIFPLGRWRIEFSVHPIPRGHRSGHTILWEAEHEVGAQSISEIRWPNRFSRFIGDKAFGLLLADCLGLSVPKTHVVARAVAPFTFGKTTGTGEPWIRTCPIEPIPGKFTTLRGWTDPFKLLADEDPNSATIASVLSQEGVRSIFSGAAIGSRSRDFVVEGVNGIGSDFMLGRRAPEELPESVIGFIEKLLERSVQLVGGTVKLEWAFDGEIAWVLQMQQLEQDQRGAVIVSGDPSEYRQFDTTLGIDQFRNFVEKAKRENAGVVLIGAVGITSHFGDILRRSGIPSRMGWR